MNNLETKIKRKLILAEMMNGKVRVFGKDFEIKAYRLIDKPRKNDIIKYNDSKMEELIIGINKDLGILNTIARFDNYHIPHFVHQFSDNILFYQPLDVRYFKKESKTYAKFERMLKEAGQ